MSQQQNKLIKEEIKLLIRAARSKTRFRFMIVQYNHYDLVRRVEKELKATYQERIISKINLNENLSSNLPISISDYKTDFLLIENFEELFLEENTSIANGFNQRRDSYAKLNLIIIAFIPFGSKYLQGFAQSLPDLYSITNPVIQLKQEIEATKELSLGFSTFMDMPFNSSKDAKAEIERIEDRLRKLEGNTENTNLIFILKHELGKVYYFLNEYDKSKTIFEKLLSNSEYLLEDDRVIIKANLADTYEALGKYDKALSLTEEALKSDLNNYGISHSRVAERYNEKASKLRKLGKYEEASRLLKSALKIDLENLGSDDIMILSHQSNLAMIYNDLGKYKSAIELNIKNLNLIVKVYGKKNTTYFVEQSNMALSYSSIGMNEKAIKLIREVLYFHIDKWGNNNHRTALIRANLALFLLRSNKRKLAKQLARKSYKTYLRKLGQNHPDTIGLKQWAKENNINL